MFLMFTLEYSHDTTLRHSRGSIRLDYSPSSSAASSLGESTSTWKQRLTLVLF